jgi:hypothetical protein
VVDRGLDGDLRRIVQGMTAIFFLVLIIAIAALAPKFGADSRGLRDHPWEPRSH